ncbi:MAG: hypothetical protein ACI4RD_05605 [Kiritimatiellia bacterium]
MPVLKWAGKDKVVNHHHDVPFRVLERKWGYGAAKPENPDNPEFPESPEKETRYERQGDTQA